MVKVRAIVANAIAIVLLIVFAPILLAAHA
jgi:hypothetical protein